MGSLCESSCDSYVTVMWQLWCSYVIGVWQLWGRYVTVMRQLCDSDVIVRDRYVIVLR